MIRSQIYYDIDLAVLEFGCSVNMTCNEIVIIETSKKHLARIDLKSWLDAGPRHCISLVAQLFREGEEGTNLLKHFRFIRIELAGDVEVIVTVVTGEKSAHRFQQIK